MNHDVQAENAELKRKGNASHACYCGELPSGKKCMACQLQTAERSLKELQRERDQAHDLLDMAFADHAKESACAKCREHTPGYRLAALVEIMERSLAELREKMRWIPVAEKFPEFAGTYIVAVDGLGDDGENYIGTLPADWSPDGKYWHDLRGWGSNEVTHWMPLPDPPVAEAGGLLEEG